MRNKIELKTEIKTAILRGDKYYKGIIIPCRQTRGTSVQINAHLNQVVDEVMDKLILRYKK